MELEPDVNSDFQCIEKEANIDIIENERRLICERAAKRNITRTQHNNRCENDFFLENIQNKKDISAVARLRLEQEENLSKELNRIKKEEIVTLKMRQHLRETSDELRELESKLKAAYVNKEVSAQIAEKKYFKQQEQMNNLKSDMVLRNTLAKFSEMERIRVENEIKKKAIYKKELQNQMIMQHQAKQHQYEEFLIEKKMIDDIVQRIQDEDLREMEDKMYKMRKTQTEIQTFKAAQEIWKQREKKKIEEENKRIIEFLKQKEIEQKEKDKLKVSKGIARDKMIEDMSKKIYRDQEKKRERDEILQDLLLEESKEKDLQKVKQEFETMIRKRVEAQNVLEWQLEERAKKIKQDELEDIQYREQMLIKIREDDKLEQMTTEKRRIKMIEYRRDIEEIIKERRAKRAEELREIMYMQEQDKLRSEQRKKIIQDERIKLLKEHAANLIGYLPPGILRAEDLPLLGSEFASRYTG